MSNGALSGYDHLIGHGEAAGRVARIQNVAMGQTGRGREGRYKDLQKAWRRQALLEEWPTVEQAVTQAAVCACAQSLPSICVC